MNEDAGAVAYAVVIPTLGRPSLGRVLTALAAGEGPRPTRIVLVDDRPPDDPNPLPVAVPATLRDLVEIVPGRGAGPAAARNTGWRRSPEPWIAFLDDDVVPGPDWAAALADDLAAAEPDIAGVQARIAVPLPLDRAPTDWERCTAGLATARWITADMAYRRAALESVGGFDERFPRAFREDADLALRVLAKGWILAVGERRTQHPVRPADAWVSVRQQAGNADDVLMRRLHGPDWWARADAPRGRLARHAAITAAGLGALGAAVVRRRGAAAALGALWLVGTGEFAAARVLPGPRTREEVRRMLATSALIPPMAVAHWLVGHVRHRSVVSEREAAAEAQAQAEADARARARSDGRASDRAEGYTPFHSAISGNSDAYE
ncbi:glycosyltransferase family 2 protein [Streptomyces sp. PT12]|uniref:glycosyltransferase family 2 protein n=1 Tax=Streptomyces sp. PT12 TaxID=1510197 RepID=UPI000DE3D529|nr:glycosyltransferase [Streptomyces sp. PT12]RBM16125.1 transferase [Streptomyces sp. PT12]